jgi:fused signal recognition particle receptor
MRKFGASGHIFPGSRDGIIPRVVEDTWRQALKRTHNSTMGRIAQLLGNSEIKDDFWTDLETVLIQADVGFLTTQSLIDEFKLIVHENGFTRGVQVQTLLADRLINSMKIASLPMAISGPSVTILIGVNGVGKTTCAAKLAYWVKTQGKSVLLAAADTYRAAASEQLTLWGNQLGVNVISGKPGSDPGAVAYDACHSALAKGFDHLIIDTSGRMHTEHNLMDELNKIIRVCGKVIEGAPHATLLVMDATTGQNGLAQARAFRETVALDGIILAKLDGSAKGGIAITIQHSLDLPVLFVGLGETHEDLKSFDPPAYINSLLAIH